MSKEIERNFSSRLHRIVKADKDQVIITNARLIILVVYATAAKVQQVVLTSNVLRREMHLYVND